MIKPGIQGILFLALSVLMGLAAVQAENLSPSGDAFIGAYQGIYRATGRAELPATGKVISEGPGLYRMLVQYAVPDPDGQTEQIELHGHTEGPHTLFYGFSNAVFWNGEAADGKLTVNRAEGHYGGAFELQKFIAHSPSELKAPPEGAIVLLAYEEGKAPDLSAWTNGEWEAREDGAMVVKPGSGANYTKQQFGDMRLPSLYNYTHKRTA